MELAIAILLSTVLALVVWQVGKYNKWRTFGKSLLWSVAAAVVLVFGYYIYLQNDERGRAQAEHEEELLGDTKLARERAARHCIAGDVSRMEKLVKKATDRVVEGMPVDLAQLALTITLQEPSSLETPEDALTDLAIVNYVRTTCDSDFKFLINVRAHRVDDNGEVSYQLAWLKVWAQYAPSGYTPPNFDKDFDETRATAARAASDQQDRAQMRAHEAALEARTAAPNDALQAAIDASAKRVAQQRANEEAQRRSDDEIAAKHKHEGLAERERVYLSSGPCEVGISTDERLKRLAATGKPLRMDDETWMNSSFKLVIGADGNVVECVRR